MPTNDDRLIEVLPAEDLEPTAFIQQVEEVGLTLPPRIRSQKMYQQVHEALSTFAAMRKKIVSHYKPAKQQQKKAYDVIRSLEKDALSTCEPFERQCKSLLLKFEQERDAKKEAELKAKMEQARADAETKREAELAALSTQIENAPQDHRNALERIQTTLAHEPITPEHVASKPAYVRPQGVQRRELFSAKCVNLKQLVDAVSNGQADIECLKPNETYLNARARQDKRLLNIPGVQVLVKFVMASGGR
jgi:hypothetical protein